MVAGKFAGGSSSGEIFVPRLPDKSRFSSVRHVEISPRIPLTPVSAGVCSSPRRAEGG